MLQPKGTDWLNGYKNKTCMHAVHKRSTTDRDTQRVKVRGWKIIPCKSKSKESQSSNTQKQTTDFKLKTVTRDKGGTM